MGLAQDLLQQADHLAAYEGANPSQASLRRAVSTAYYALFHLLVEEAGQRWSGSSEARTGMERAFQHGPMKNTSMQFRKKIWEDWHSNQKGNTFGHPENCECIRESARGAARGRL
jgi:hypothetical protein